MGYAVGTIAVLEQGMQYWNGCAAATLAVVECNTTTDPSHWYESSALEKDLCHMGTMEYLTTEQAAKQKT